jgi:hypothetical protein
VPVVEFGAVWTAAEELYRSAPQSRYIGGVCAACRWVTRYPGGLSPLYRQDIEATASTVLEEDMIATAISMEFAGADPTISREWATGVAMTLGWVRGALQSTPVSHDRPMAT